MMLSASDYSIYQTRDEVVYTKIMRGPWHVTTLTTFTERGGRRVANRFIKGHRRVYE